MRKPFIRSLRAGGLVQRQHPAHVKTHWEDQSLRVSQSQVQIYFVFSVSGGLLYFTYNSFNGLTSWVPLRNVVTVIKCGYILSSAAKAICGKEYISL